MKQKILILGSVIFATLVLKAQVGINTETPRATLDINVSSKTDSNEGIIIPELSRTRLAQINPNNLTKNTIVFANTTGNGDLTTQEVRRDGLFYYNGAIWQPLNYNYFIKQGQGYVVDGLNDDLTLTNRYKGNKIIGYNAIDFSDGSGGAFGNYSFIQGANNKITENGYYSSAFGESNTINSSYSGAFGENNTINTIYGHSFVAGSDNTLNGGYSFAFGKDLTTQSPLEFVIGVNNEKVEEGEYLTSGTLGANRAFVIGNGTKARKQNALTVWYEGYWKFNLINPQGTIDAYRNQWNLNFIPKKGMNAQDLSGKINTYDGEKWRKYIPVIFSNTQPSNENLEAGDLWFDTSVKKYKVWNGSEWTSM
ncbi:hypothetical protein [Riemerella columbipharyngis]|uniref:Uncharacterized protein n=1 Tax=Riemerella columbipharyngis TaxID=1071918 RepID=A0A1G6ZAM4_9FLAO|nr:hypothetical protein [Riemerella columbipharyngis]SDD99512.1 hypothetical protein SAMN05421544_10217 [Riemerella columbipharyngis]